MKQSMGVFLSTVVALWSFSQIAAHASDKEKAEQQILKTLEQRGEAQIQRDFPALERLMAEECTYTHASSQTQSKVEFIADLKSGKRVYKALKNTDLHVTLYGHTAVLTGRSDISAVNDGKDVEVPTKFLEVYVNRDGRWQMVAHESTRLAPGQP
jgi:ketosteroid isomerase-like protein